MMGERRVRQEALFYEFSLERHAGKALVAVDRSVRRTRRAATGAGAVLQRDRAAIGRSGAAGSHAHRWLLLRHPLGAAYRWFCGLGLDGEVPDHSTFSKN